MKYYIDITLIPDAEAGLGFLWQKVYQQVHIALVDNKVAANESLISIAIVKYADKAFPMGDKLRLLAGEKSALIDLNVTEWLSRFTDYCHVTSIKKVPDNISKFAVYKRKSVKSLHKKAKSRATHLSKPYTEVLSFLINEGKYEDSSLPYVYLESQETKKYVGNDGQFKFPLFIEQTITMEPKVGTFDCYGLSKTATVPYF